LVVTVNTLPPNDPPANVPLAPLGGAVNVTVSPLEGLPPESFTVTVRRVAKAVLMVAVWGVPLVGEMVAVAPPVLVSEKAAGAAPGTEAVTK
jgi:hypothetical protein